MSKMTTDAKFEALYIDPTCMKKINYWTEAADGEVSGLGIVEKEEDRMVVRDVYILEQECSGADTELDPEAISKLMQDMIKDDKDPGKLKFWWHSHVNMGVFWSGTDDACAETLSKEFAFSLVVNKKKDKKARLDLYSPFRITLDNIKVLELSSEDEDLKKICEEEVKSKVRTKTYGVTRHYNNGYRGHYNGYGYGGYYEDEFDNKFEKSGVKLSNEEVEEIERLEDIVFTGGYKDETLQEYITAIVRATAEDMYFRDSDCKDGVGSLLDETDEVCVKCKMFKKCAVLSEKYGDNIEFIDEDDYITKGDLDDKDGDIIIDVDNDN